MKTNKQIVVSGASGFIGRALTRLLLAEGYSVVAIYRKHEIPFDSENLIKIKADLNNREDLLKLKKYVDQSFAFIHLAGIIPKSSLSSEEDLLKNIEMNHQLGNILNDEIHFVFVSTVDINKNGSSGAYEKSKLESENQFKKLFKRNPSNLCILRLSHTYGPGDSSQKIINRLIRHTIIRDQVKIYGADESRDYVYIDDVCWTLIGLITHNFYGEYFLSSGKYITIEDLYDTVVDGKPAKLRVSDYSNNNAVKLLGVKTTKLDVGISNTKLWTIRQYIREGMCNIFCDLDGVLLDNKHKYFKIHSDIIKKITGNSTRLTLLKYWKLKRSKASVSSILSIERLPGDLVESYQDIFLNSVEQEKYLELDRPNRSNLIALQDIRTKNQVSLLTLRNNTSNTTLQLKRLNLENMFEEIFIGGTSRNKPFPKDYFIEKHRNPKKINIVVGDTETDIMAAKKSNIFSIGLSCGIRDMRMLQRSRPDLILKNLTALLEQND